MRARILGVALAALGAAAAFVIAPPAHAATSVTFTPQTIFMPRLPDDGTVDQNVVPVGTVSAYIPAGQTAYVVSKMRVNNATIRSLFDNEIVCEGPGGWSKNMVIGQNVYDPSLGRPDWEDVTLTTRFLVRPGVAGTVTCTANARGNSLSADADASYRLVGGSLQFADLSVPNTVTGTEPQQSLTASALPVNASTPTVRQPALDFFQLPAGYTNLNVVGDTEFVVCYPFDGCDRRGSTTARFTLYVNQWKADGSLCHTDAGMTLTRTVPYYVHHLYVPLNKPDFEIRTGDGCIPRFNAYVKVDWLGGQRAGVQGTAHGLVDYRGAPTTHSADMSHAFVLPS